MSKVEYRSDIDGLRAMAVLLVVAFHAFPHTIKGGFIGVDIFFVISGFLISRIIFNGYINTNRFNLGNFYARRINRIFPALILILTACFCFGWFVLLPDEYAALNKHILAGASFVANILLWNESGYFDAAAVKKPLLHLWSLGIEEQFYILWPILLCLVWKNKTHLALTIIVFAAISFLLNLNFVHYDQVSAFYLPQMRFWELLAGSFLAFMSLKNEERADQFISKNKANYLSIFGIILISAAVLFIKGGRHYPGWSALLPTLGAFLLISAGDQAWINRVFLSNRLMVWFGLISFPLYLWHWPLLAYARIINGARPSWQVQTAAVVFAIICAWLTYQFIEKPLRSAKNKALSSIILVVCMLIISLAAFTVYRGEGLPKRAGIKKLTRVYAQFGANWSYSTNDYCLKNYPIKGSKNYLWTFCIANKKEKPTLILMGNSYANHLYAGLVKNKYFRQESILSIGTCDPQWYDKSMLANNKLSTHPCSGLRPLFQQRSINKIIKKEGSVKYAILSGLAAIPDEKYIENIKKRVDFLEKNKIKVIVFKPHIQLNYDIRNCFSRPLNTKSLSSCELDLDTYKKSLQRFELLVQSLKKSNPRVAFFDPNPLFCDSHKCSMIRKGIPLLRDEHNHLSEYGSIELAKIFEKWAQQNIPEIAINRRYDELKSIG